MSNASWIVTVNRTFGVIGLLMAFVFPFFWLIAAIGNDPEKSMSDAEYVFDYVARHGNLTGEQMKIMNDGVIAAHGHSVIIRYTPLLYPVLFFFSAIVHFLSASRRLETEKKEPKQMPEATRSGVAHR